MTPNKLTTKAGRGPASSKLLLDSGDVGGACNRAYYRGAPASLENAAWALDQSKKFLTAVQTLIDHH